MPRKLAVLFDGTWNTTKDRTNVVHLSELIAATGSDDGEQLPSFYDKGHSPATRCCAVDARVLSPAPVTPPPSTHIRSKNHG